MLHMLSETTIETHLVIVCVFERLSKPPAHQGGTACLGSRCPILLLIWSPPGSSGMPPIRAELVG
ncbi:MAG: hypothetical protein WCP28_13000 [Actinomycetes bacterium]